MAPSKIVVSGPRLRFFRHAELLAQRSSQKPLASLAKQVADLAEANSTLRRYLEQVMTKVAPNESAKIIEDENERLKAAHAYLLFSRNPFVRFLERTTNLSVDVLRSAISGATNPDELISNLGAHVQDPTEKDLIVGRLVKTLRMDNAQRDLNRARGALDRPPLFPRWEEANSRPGTVPDESARDTRASPEA